MLEPQSWSLLASVLVFAGGALVTLVGGVRLAALGDRLADRLGWGEAIFGAAVFGAATSTNGIVMGATAASGGFANLAYSSAIGGIAAQTFALALADLFYRRTNLEHASASLVNLFSGVHLMGLLAVAAALSFTPSATLFGVHPGTPLLLVAWLFGLRLSGQMHARPLWHPEETRETRPDVPDEKDTSRPTWGLSVDFLAMVGVVGASGYLVTKAAEGLLAQTGISETTAGALLLGVVQALPETITAIAFVRRGALTLAVAGILGGNAFDVLNLGVADVFFRSGSLFHNASEGELFLTLTTITMTSVLVGGMLRRQTKGVANIGYESLLVIVLYGAIVFLLPG